MGKDDSQEMMLRVVVAVVIIAAVCYVIYKLYQHYTQKQQPKVLPQNEYGWTVLPDGTKVLM